MRCPVGDMSCPFESCDAPIFDLPDPRKVETCEWVCPKCGATGVAEVGTHFNIGTGIPGHDYTGYHWTVKTIRTLPTERRP